MQQRFRDRPETQRHALRSIEMEAWRKDRASPPSEAAHADATRPGPGRPGDGRAGRDTGRKAHVGRGVGQTVPGHYGDRGVLSGVR